MKRIPFHFQMLMEYFTYYRALARLSTPFKPFWYGTLWVNINIDKHWLTSKCSSPCVTFFLYFSGIYQYYKEMLLWSRWTLHTLNLFLLKRKIPEKKTLTNWSFVKILWWTQCRRIQAANFIVYSANSGTRTYFCR